MKRTENTPISLLLEKDISEIKNCVSIANIFRKIAVLHFHDLIFNIKRLFNPYKKIDFEDRPVFVVQIENNLNPMIPIAEQLSLLGMKPVFVIGYYAFHRMSEHSRSLIKQYDLYFPELMRMGQYKRSKKEAYEISSYKKLLLTKRANTLYKKMSGFLAYYCFYMIASSFYKHKAFFRHLISTKPPLFIATGRPQRILTNSILSASTETVVPTFFMSHTTWLDSHRSIYDLADLRLFGYAAMYSYRCVSRVSNSNPSIKPFPTGWPNRKSSTIPHPTGNRKKIVVGYPAGSDLEGLKTITKAIIDSGCACIIKTHPPGDNKTLFQEATHGSDDCVLKDHKELSLFEFFCSIDLLVSGKSNVGIEAASYGIPTISYYTEKEKSLLSIRKRCIETVDISIEKAESLDELGKILNKFCNLSAQEQENLWIKQKKRHRSFFPDYSAAETTKEILSLVRTHKTQ